jgi:hypothetical protein
MQAFLKHAKTEAKISLFMKIPVLWVLALYCSEDTGPTAQRQNPEDWKLPETQTSHFIHAMEAALYITDLNWAGFVAKLTAAQLHKIFMAFCEIWKFITVFKTARTR